MNDNFAPFELAVKLKEKGFREPCIAHYCCLDGNILKFNITTDCIRGSNVKCLNDENNIYTDAPTISQVLKWLRKKYYIHISTKPYPCEDGVMWLYEIRKFNEYKSVVVANKTGFIKEEQATFAGIECVLDNLI